ncbi:MAG: Rv1355c family protein [Bacteroidia bacterium]
MKQDLYSLKEQARKLHATFEPSFFRLKNLNEREQFNAILQSHPSPIVFDQIQSQVAELLKCNHPQKIYTVSELDAAVAQHIGSKPEEYGVWIFYPWSNRLVHLLDEEEFVEVRTNRNQLKITREEKDLLLQKKIGVIGLSVGQSIALTLATERICGEIRIADFDTLDLSNLNRIRTGVHNLGLSKTVIVAREIAEMDPYLKVTCYNSGISKDNIDEFLLNNGKLDILVDECDDLLVKILCREKAKEKRVPVIMDTSDRGMLDVERFDLEPSRSILHGLIDHLDVNKVSEAKTNEEKIPFILAIIGIDTISERMKLSMKEVKKTITTWPQLASSVVLGGGLSADVCRRILLGTFHDSGRYFVDLEELIANKKK